MDAATPSYREYRGKLAFTRKVILAYAGMDLAFKLLVVPAHLDLSGTQATPRGPAAIVRAVIVSAAFVGALFAALALLARPIERWLRLEAEGKPSDEAIRRAGAELDRLPQRLALLWSAEWAGLAVTLAILNGGMVSNAGFGFFLGALVLGPLPLAHSLAVWLLAPIVRRHSLIARAAGVAAAGRPMSFVRRLALYSLCLCIAPTSYMAAVAFSVHVSKTTMDHLVLTVTIYFAGVAVFAVLCALLLATTISEPVGEMLRVMRTIARQGDVSSVGRVPVYQRDELGALADVTNVTVDRLERTAVEREKAKSSLEELNRSLELRVTERTAELEGRNADMRLVLDNVNQGLFTMDRAGAMSSERSAVLANWFGRVVPGEPFWRYFGAHSRRFALEAEVAWDEVCGGILPMELALDQMPKRLSAGGKHFRFSYQPIGAGVGKEAADEALLERFLVVVSDSTEEIQREVAEREKRETLALFERMIADRSGFVDFMEEGGEIVASLGGPSRGEAATARALHTLKGNSMMFGVESVAEVCHELESAMFENRRLPNKEELRRLEERWSRLAAEVDGLLGERRRVVEMSLEQHAELERAIQGGVPRETILRVVRELRLEPVEHRLKRFAEQAERIGARLEKRVAANIIHDGVRLDSRRFAKFWGALVHAVRNAVDHGIEAPEQRRAADKPEEGTVWLRAQREGSDVVIEIEDDGRGIAWDRVRERSAERGHEAATEAELLALLFAGGVSTADAVTNVSGRGVGFGALSSSVEALGGGLRVWSVAERGTKLRMTFPDAEAARESNASPSIPA